MCGSSFSLPESSSVSESVSTNPVDFGAFWGCLCFLFTTGLSVTVCCSTSSLVSESVSTNSGVLVLFWVVLLQVLVHSLSHLSLYNKLWGFWCFLGLSLFSFYHEPLCHSLLFHAAYQKIISCFRKFLCFIIHLSGPIIVLR